MGAAPHPIHTHPKRTEPSWAVPPDAGHLLAPGQCPECVRHGSTQALRVLHAHALASRAKVAVEEPSQAPGQVQRRLSRFPAASSRSLRPAVPPAGRGFGGSGSIHDESHPGFEEGLGVSFLGAGAPSSVAQGQIR